MCRQNKKEILKFLRINVSGNTTCQKARNVEESSTDEADDNKLLHPKPLKSRHLKMHLKDLGKQEQTKSKVNTRKEITSVRAEVNEK